MINRHLVHLWRLIKIHRILTHVCLHQIGCLCYCCYVKTSSSACSPKTSQQSAIKPYPPSFYLILLYQIEIKHSANSLKGKWSQNKQKYNYDMKFRIIITQWKYCSMINLASVLVCNLYKGASTSIAPKTYPSCKFHQKEIIYLAYCPSLPCIVCKLYCTTYFSWLKVGPVL